MAVPGMAFKLTYSDGQSTDYDDSTKWEVENGVVKLGREAGKWTVSSPRVTGQRWNWRPAKTKTTATDKKDDDKSDDETKTTDDQRAS